ncbi:MAG: HEAT repeat domain-containing protein [Planctomycetes bacterium]|nr:HEAT repeat domain-containing protein [Planctomycetota bacterium]
MSKFCVALLAASVLASCTTTMTKDGVEMPPEYIEAADAPKKTVIDVHEEKVGEVVEAVAFDRGPALLKDLEWLIAQRELAIPMIIDGLAEADLRTRANLLYVLGFSRSPETTRVLTDNMASPDPIVRFEAAAGLLQHGDTTSVPVLVDFLESDDQRLRYKAIEALRSGTGNDFSYSFSAPEEIRTVSVSKWRTWWQSEKQRLMYRTWDGGGAPR